MKKESKAVKEKRKREEKALVIGKRVRNYFKQHGLENGQDGYIVGIDPAGKSTGFSVITLKDNAPVISTVLNPGGKSRLMRVDRMFSGIQLYLQRIKTYGRILFVGLEDHAYGAKRSGKQFAEITGMFRMFFHQNNLPCLMISPTSVRNFVMGDGGASKNDVFLHLLNNYPDLYKEFNIGDEFDDRFDAHAIAITASGTLQYILSGNLPVDAHPRESIVTLILRCGRAQYDPITWDKRKKEVDNNVRLDI